jgi:hypothetical protein
VFKPIEIIQTHIFVGNHDRFQTLGTEVILKDLIEDLIFFLLGHFLSVELIDHIIRAVFKEKIRGTLHKNSYEF